MQIIEWRIFVKFEPILKLGSTHAGLQFGDCAAADCQGQDVPESALSGDFPALLLLTSIAAESKAKNASDLSVLA